MLEKDFTTKVHDQIQTLIKTSALIEYKVAKINVFNLKQWREKQGHQLASLVNVKSDTGVYFKIPDGTRGQSPADAFYMCNATAYLVIYFQRYKEFFCIDDMEYLLHNDSITYTYCATHFTSHKLPPKKKATVIDF